MNRRKFLKNTASAAAIAAVAPNILGGMPVYARTPWQNLGLAAPDNDNILIVIQMFGGNDGLNTIIPAEDDTYHQIRPNIAVPKAKAKRVLGSDVFMHPALVDKVHKNGLLGLIDNGRLAIIQGVGYENPNLSHFRSTDIWLSGLNSSDPNVRLHDGWLGRHFAKSLPNFPTEIPEHPVCVQVGGALSLMFQSEKGDMGIALTDPDKFFELGAGLSPDEEPMAGNSAYAEEFNYIRTIAEQSDTYSKVVKRAFDKGTNKLTYAAGFAQQMRLIAKLISGGLKSKVYMVSMGGFDTHVQQQRGDMTGAHPALLAAVAQGISQFMDDAVQQGFANRVVGLTVSEFGRRPYENGSFGTDHGAASVQFVFGTNVNPGNYGKTPDLKNLNSNGDLNFDVDYRRVYSEVLQTWFGATEADAIDVLGEKLAPLGVLQKPTSVQEDISFKNSLHVSPNPSFGDAKISFKSSLSGAADIAMYTLDGKRVLSVHNGFLAAGSYSFPVNFAQAGAYLCIVKTDAGQLSTKVSVLK
ncbi:MAG TPA: DUF1501 domain-containing protein [Patescibacteria group bacterium]|nr:DUF1501 domain-containing protein [Patescibacteria group bacterium]